MKDKVSTPKLKKLETRLKPADERLKPGDSWRAGKDDSASRGYGHAWRIARAQFLIEHPLCVMCYAAGIVTAATVVDHIKPHRGCMVLFWDRTNWQPLCATHHSSHKQRIEAMART